MAGTLQPNQAVTHDASDVVSLTPASILLGLRSRSSSASRSAAIHIRQLARAALRSNAPPTSAAAAAAAAAADNNDDGGGDALISEALLVSSAVLGAKSVGLSHALKQSAQERQAPVTLRAVLLGERAAAAFAVFFDRHALSADADTANLALCAVADALTVDDVAEEKPDSAADGAVVASVSNVADAIAHALVVPLADGTPPRVRRLLVNASSASGGGDAVATATLLVLAAIARRCASPARRDTLAHLLDCLGPPQRRTPGGGGGSSSQPTSGLAPLARKISALAASWLSEDAGVPRRALASLVARGDARHFTSSRTLAIASAPAALAWLSAACWHAADAQQQAGDGGTSWRLLLATRGALSAAAPARIAAAALALPPARDSDGKKGDDEKQNNEDKDDDKEDAGARHAKRTRTTKDAEKGAGDAGGDKAPPSLPPKGVTSAAASMLSSVADAVRSVRACNVPARLACHLVDGAAVDSLAAASVRGVSADTAVALHACLTDPALGLCRHSYGTSDLRTVATRKLFPPLARMRPVSVEAHRAACIAACRADVQLASTFAAHAAMGLGASSNTASALGGDAVAARAFVRGVSLVRELHAAYAYALRAENESSMAATPSHLPPPPLARPTLSRALQSSLVLVRIAALEHIAAYLEFCIPIEASTGDPATHLRALFPDAQIIIREASAAKSLLASSSSEKMPDDALLRAAASTSACKVLALWRYRDAAFAMAHRFEPVSLLTWRSSPSSADADAAVPALPASYQGLALAVLRLVVDWESAETTIKPTSSSSLGSLASTQQGTATITALALDVIAPCAPQADDLAIRALARVIAPPVGIPSSIVGEVASQLQGAMWEVAAWISELRVMRGMDSSQCRALASFFAEAVVASRRNPERFTGTSVTSDSGSHELIPLTTCALERLGKALGSKAAANRAAAVGLVCGIVVQTSAIATRALGLSLPWAKRASQDLEQLAQKVSDNVEVADAIASPPGRLPVTARAMLRDAARVLARGSARAPTDVPAASPNVVAREWPAQAHLRFLDGLSDACDADRDATTSSLAMRNAESALIGILRCHRNAAAAGDVRRLHEAEHAIVACARALPRAAIRLPKHTLRLSVAALESFDDRRESVAVHRALLNAHLSVMHASLAHAESLVLSHGMPVTVRSLLSVENVAIDRLSGLADALRECADSVEDGTSHRNLLEDAARLFDFAAGNMVVSENSRIAAASGTSMLAEAVVARPTARWSTLDLDDTLWRSVFTAWKPLADGTLTLPRSIMPTKVPGKTEIIAKLATAASAAASDATCNSRAVLSTLTPWLSEDGEIWAALDVEVRQEEGTSAEWAARLLRRRTASAAMGSLWSDALETWPKASTGMSANAADPSPSRLAALTALEHACSAAASLARRDPRSAAGGCTTAAVRAVSLALERLYRGTGSALDASLRRAARAVEVASEATAGGLASSSSTRPRFRALDALVPSAASRLGRAADVASCSFAFPAPRVLWTAVSVLTVDASTEPLAEGGASGLAYVPSDSRFASALRTHLSLDCAVVLLHAATCVLAGRMNIEKLWHTNVLTLALASTSMRAPHEARAAAAEVLGIACVGLRLAGLPQHGDASATRHLLSCQSHSFQGRAQLELLLSKAMDTLRRGAGVVPVRVAAYLAESCQALRDPLSPAFRWANKWLLGASPLTDVDRRRFFARRMLSTDSRMRRAERGWMLKAEMLAGSPGVVEVDDDDDDDEKEGGEKKVTRKRKRKMEDLSLVEDGVAMGAILSLAASATAGDADARLAAAALLAARCTSLRKCTDVAERDVREMDLVRRGAINALGVLSSSSQKEKEEKEEQEDGLDDTRVGRDEVGEDVGAPPRMVATDALVDACAGACTGKKKNNGDSELLGIISRVSRSSFDANDRTSLASLARIAQASESCESWKLMHANLAGTVARRLASEPVDGDCDDYVKLAHDAARYASSSGATDRATASSMVILTARSRALLARDDDDDVGGIVRDMAKDASRLLEGDDAATTLPALAWCKAVSL